MPRRIKQVGLVREEMQAFNFKKECHEMHITQQQAAEMMHTSRASISRWQAGQPMPPIYAKYWKLFWRMHAIQSPKKGVVRKKKPRKKAVVQIEAPVNEQT